MGDVRFFPRADLATLGRERGRGRGREGREKRRDAAASP